MLQAHPSKYPIVSSLVAYMWQVGYAPGTIEQRQRRLEALPVPPEIATRDDVLASLPVKAKPSTKRVYVSALAAAYRDLITLGLVDHNPALGVRIQGFHRGVPRPLPPSLVAQLLAEPRSKEQAWTMLGLYSGFRASDTAALYREDLVETEFGWALSVTGKGGVEALVPAHDKVVDMIRSWPGLARGPLWRTTASSVSTLWAAWVFGLTGDKYRYHQCRHTFATRVYESTGRDLMVTRDLMRHASVATTQVYTQVSVDDGYRAVAGL